MSLPTSVPRIFAGRRVVLVVGLVYVATGFSLAAFPITSGEPIVEVVLDQILVIIMGGALLAGWYWLGRSDVAAVHYRSIGVWTLGGLAAPLGIVLLYHVNPVTTVSSPERAIPLLSGLGALAGFGIGIHRARATELQRTQVQLEQTISELEASNERLEQFTRVVSHDLREPLRTMLVNLEIIERGRADRLTEDEQIMLTDAIQGASRMHEMLDGLLAYARLDAGEDATEPVDLEAVCDDILSDLDALIDDTGAEVTVGSLPTVKGNREALYQVFLNLVENAIKYSDDTPEVHIDSEATGTDWRISVSDNGLGISWADADQIFELFGRSHPDTGYEGVGLGLALCKQIVDQHGGSIELDSTPGEGSTFTIVWPVADSDEGWAPIDIERTWSRSLEHLQ